jgi:hypothetical protein
VAGAPGGELRPVRADDAGDVGLVLVAPHPSTAACHDLALDGADNADRRGRDGMIGRPII